MEVETESRSKMEVKMEGEVHHRGETTPPTHHPHPARCPTSSCTHCMSSSTRVRPPSRGPSVPAVRVRVRVRVRVVLLPPLGSCR